MNIFVLDKDPSVAASYYCDKHVVKMITETAQMLSTAQRVLGGRTDCYKETHINHPCTRWVRETSANYLWTRQLLTALLLEYDRRFDNPAGFARARKIAAFPAPFQALPGPLTPFALAMPDDCKISADPVECYRHYYQTHKAAFAKWRLGAPHWWQP